MSKIKLALEVVENLRTLASSVETMVRAIETNEVMTENEIPDVKKSNEENMKEIQPDENQPTLEEVRAAMADKSRDGHREAVKAIITKYGVNNLSALEPKHYAAALKDVEEIK